MFVLAAAVSHSPANETMSSPLLSWLKKCGWPAIGLCVCVAIEAGVGRANRRSESNARGDLDGHSPSDRPSAQSARARPLETINHKSHLELELNARRQNNLFAGNPPRAAPANPNQSGQLWFRLAARATTLSR